MQQRKNNDPKYFFCGFLIGAANTMPGISGGSIALILGIYERLISNMALIRPKSLINLKSPQGRANLFAQIDARFLATIFLGLLFGIFVCSLFIPSLVETYPSHMNALFLGLMVASLPHVLKLYDRAPNLSHLAIMFMTIGFTLAFNSLPSMMQANNFVFQFFIGMLAISAMLLPGISGSFILLLFGNYKYVFSQVSLAFQFNFDAVFNLVPFVLGVICGGLVFVRLVDYCFSNFRYATISVLLGLMIGGFKTLWPFVNESKQATILPSAFGVSEVYMVLLFVAGLALALVSMSAKFQEDK